MSASWVSAWASSYFSVLALLADTLRSVHAPRKTGVQAVRGAKKAMAERTRGGLVYGVTPMRAEAILDPDPFVSILAMFRFFFLRPDICLLFTVFSLVRWGNFSGSSALSTESIIRLCVFIDGTSGGHGEHFNPVAPQSRVFCRLLLLAHFSYLLL